jgi:hypothetical protein
MNGGMPATATSAPFSAPNAIDDEQAGGHAAQPEHRAEAQVDALGEDDQRHAERDDGEHGDLQQHVHQVGRREEPGGPDRERDAHGREQVERARRLLRARDRGRTHDDLRMGGLGHGLGAGRYDVMSS